MARIGATPEELTALKGTFDRQSQLVDGLVREVSTKLEGVDWQGPARDRFVQMWQTQFQPALQRLRESLQEAGNEADRVGQNIRVAGGG